MKDRPFLVGIRDVYPFEERDVARRLSRVPVVRGRVKAGRGRLGAAANFGRRSTPSNELISSSSGSALSYRLHRGLFAVLELLTRPVWLGRAMVRGSSCGAE